MTISKTTAIIGTLGAGGGAVGTVAGVRYLYPDNKESNEALGDEESIVEEVALETVEEVVVTSLEPVIPEREENPSIPKVEGEVSRETATPESLPAKSPTTEQQPENQKTKSINSDSDTKTSILNWSKEGERKCEVRIKYDNKAIAVKNANSDDEAALKEVWSALNGENKDTLSNKCKPNLENRRENESVEHYLDLEKESNGKWDVGEIEDSEIGETSEK